MMDNDIKNIMIKEFIRLEQLTEKVKKIDNAIKDIVGFFCEPEESSDETVKEYLVLKDIYLDEMDHIRRILNLLERLIINKPKAVISDYFINMFENTQRNLDFVNIELNKYTLIEGVRELFTGLCYGEVVESYSVINLFYIEYKFPKIFGEDVKLKYPVKYSETEEKIIPGRYEDEEPYK